jgi:hypothetical protein
MTTRDKPGTTPENGGGRPVVLARHRLQRRCSPFVPELNALPLCREFNVFAALHTALREPPPDSGPMHF